MSGCDPVNIQHNHVGTLMYILQTWSQFYLFRKPPKRSSELFKLCLSGRSCSAFETGFTDCSLSGNGNERERERDAETSSSSSSFTLSGGLSWSFFLPTVPTKKGSIPLFGGFISAPKASSRFGTSSCNL
jgi:hypothetical protein